MMDITQIISNLGFPIACVCACGMFINNMTKQQREDNINRENKMLEQMGEISATNKLLVETNAEIANKLDVKLDTIDDKLDKIMQEKRGVQYEN